jgi:hypothetical protein
VLRLKQIDLEIPLFSSSSFFHFSIDFVVFRAFSSFRLRYSLEIGSGLCLI